MACDLGSVMLCTHSVCPNLLWLWLKLERCEQATKQCSPATEQRLDTIPRYSEWSPESFGLVTLKTILYSNANINPKALPPSRADPSRALNHTHSNWLKRMVWTVSAIHLFSLLWHTGEVEGWPISQHLLTSRLHSAVCTRKRPLVILRKCPSLVLQLWTSP